MIAEAPTSRARAAAPAPQPRWLRAAIAAASLPMPVLPFQRAARQAPALVMARAAAEPAPTRPVAIAAR